MMYAAQAAPSLWPYLIPAVPAFLVAVAALLGWWLTKKREPAANRLITAQTEQVETDIIHKSVEAAVRTGEFTLKAMERADAEIDHLTAQKQSLEAEKELLKATLRKEMEDLRRDVKVIDDGQARIFLLLGELQKAGKKGEE